MKAETVILCDLLQCGFLDVEYLSDICERNEIDIDTQEIKESFWELHMNVLIYDALRQIADKFLDENLYEIWEILEVSDMKEYIAENELYEIYTNYLDSHLWFKDQEIQNLFENSKYRR